MNKYKVRVVMEMSVIMDVEANSIDDAAEIIDGIIEKDSTELDLFLKYTEENNVDTQLIYKFDEENVE